MADSITSGFLKDTNGNLSSKRLWGSVLLGVGCMMSIILFCFSLTRPIGDPSTAVKIIESIIISGGSLLGIGIFENFKLGSNR